MNHSLKICVRLEKRRKEVSKQRKKIDKVSKRKGKERCRGYALCTHGLSSVQIGGSDYILVVTRGNPKMGPILGMLSAANHRVLGPKAPRRLPSRPNGSRTSSFLMRPEKARNRRRNLVISSESGPSSSFGSPPPRCPVPH